MRTTPDGGVARHLFVRADRLHVAAEGGAVEDQRAARRDDAANTQIGTGTPKQARVVDRAVQIGQRVVERDRAAIGEAT